MALKEISIKNKNYIFGVASEKYSQWNSIVEIKEKFQ